MKGVSGILLGVLTALSGYAQYPGDTLWHDEGGALKDNFVIAGILFQYDSYELFAHNPSEKLDSLAELMKADGGTFEIQGHRDCRGSNSYSKCLSCGRARTIMEELIARGVDKEKISSKGYGEDVPRLLVDGTLLTCNYISVQATPEEKEPLHQLNRRICVQRISP